jgi:hypothetical protein
MFDYAVAMAYALCIRTTGLTFLLENNCVYPLSDGVQAQLYGSPPAVRAIILLDFGGRRVSSGNLKKKNYSSELHDVPMIEFRIGFGKSVARVN